jgi:hypothetical protein
MHRLRAVSGESAEGGERAGANEHRSASSEVHKRVKHEVRGLTLRSLLV